MLKAMGIRVSETTENDCRTILRRMGLFEMVEKTPCFAASALLDAELCADDCCKQRSVREERERVVLGAEGEGNDEALELGLNGVLAGMIASAVPAGSEGVTVRTELAYFSCQPRRRTPVHF